MSIQKTEIILSLFFDRVNCFVPNEFTPRLQKTTLIFSSLRKRNGERTFLHSVYIENITGRRCSVDNIFCSIPLINIVLFYIHEKRDIQQEKNEKGAKNSLDKKGSS